MPSSDDPILRPRAPIASNPLLSAGLSGLLLLTSCQSGCDDETPIVDASVPNDANVTTDASHETDAGVDAGTQVDAGEVEDAGEATDAGEVMDAGEAMDSGESMDASVVADAESEIPDIGSVDASCDANRVRVITLSDASPGMTLAAFVEMCAPLGGFIEIHPHCGGANSCAGISYDESTGILTEHTCAGLNTCNGYSCVIP